MVVMAEETVVAAKPVVTEKPAVDDASAEAEKPAEDKETLAGHSYHGEVFNEGPRQAAYLMEGTGDVEFPATCKDDTVQKFINQGVGQLHGFWFFEAERSFRQAAALDPDCAIAYWGMAMANRSNSKRGRGLIAEAVKRKDKASKREQMYIDALDAFLKQDPVEKKKEEEAKAAKEDDKKESKKELTAEQKKEEKEKKEERDKKRRQNYIRAYDKIIHDFPEDLEAKAFLGLAIYENRSRGVPINSYYTVDALMNDVLDKKPLHPVHHFRIHLWDYEKAENAVNSAGLCGTGSPGIAHMWHMPGHIYSRLKRYEDAAWQQEASARVDHAHMMRDRVMPDQIHNFAHNNEWLIRNLVHIGRADAALDLAKNMIDLPRHPKYNTLDKRGSTQYGRMRLFDVLTTFEMWDELVKLSETRYLEPTEKDSEKQKRARWVAIAKFRSGDVMGGCEILTQRMEALDKLTTERDKKVAEAKDKAKKEKKDDKAIKKAGESAARAFTSRIRKIEADVNELKAMLHLAHGADVDAAPLLEKVSGFNRGWLAIVQVRAGEKEKALKTIQKHLDYNKNETVPLAQAVLVYHELGDKKKARESFDKLRKMSSSIAIKTPMFARLAPIAKEYGFEEDWRLEREIPEDFGERPELASLGPFRWSPSPAAPWTLTDHENKAHSLEDYKGKPVVVIFYLGFGCLHCAEQLQAFAPKSEEFEKAGISLIAISTDDHKGLKQSIENYEEGSFSFPLVSDAELAVFKEYRCYDDFEKQTLHGTFLIDGDGFVRWQDLSYEPFMDADFLIKESKRLLSQPHAGTPPHSGPIQANRE